MIGLESTTPVFVICLVLLLTALRTRGKLKRVPDSAQSSFPSPESADGNETYARIEKIAHIVEAGAANFTHKMYVYLAIYCVSIMILLYLLLGVTDNNWTLGALSALAYFVVGAAVLYSTDMARRTALLTPVRALLQGRLGVRPAFEVLRKAASSGTLGGVALGVLALLVLTLIIQEQSSFMSESGAALLGRTLLCGAAGASSIALFARMSASVFAGASKLSSRLSADMYERVMPAEDPRNPAVLAALVGEVVGGVSGTELESLAILIEVLALVFLGIIYSPMYQDWELRWETLVHPLIMAAACLLASAISAIYFRRGKPLFTCCSGESDPESERSAGLQVSQYESVYRDHFHIAKLHHDRSGLENNVTVEEFQAQEILSRNTIRLMALNHYILTAVLSTIFTSFIVLWAFHSRDRSWYSVSIGVCMIMGIWGAVFITAYHHYLGNPRSRPTSECANACSAGVAPSLIYGLALGYKSSVFPTFVLAVIAYIANERLPAVGIPYVALGAASLLGSHMLVSLLNPLARSVAGIARAGDAYASHKAPLDYVQRETIASASASQGYLTATSFFTTTAVMFLYLLVSHGIPLKFELNILQPFPMVGLFVGAMLPFWASALVNRATNDASFELLTAIMLELDQRTERGMGIRMGSLTPDYHRIISHLTRVSIHGALVTVLLTIICPTIVGFLLGRPFLLAMLFGACVAGTPLASSFAASGSAWAGTLQLQNDRAIAVQLQRRVPAQSQQVQRQQQTDLEKQSTLSSSSSSSSSASDGIESTQRSAVVSDSVGNAFKLACAPCLHLFIKSMAIIALTLCKSFPDDGWLQQLFR